MSTLYDIDTRLEACVDPETGEILDFEAFENLQMERSEKLENTALWYKNLQADIKALKEEEDKLSERRHAAERKAENLKSYLDYALGGEKFTTPRVQLSFRKSEKVVVSDEEAFIKWSENESHNELLTYKAPQINKKAVKEFLNSGNECEFAAIEQSNNLQIK